MTDENIREQARRRRGPRPLGFETIEYPFRRRMADRWQGWRDGRKGIPAIPDREAAAGPWTRIVDESGETSSGPGVLMVSQMHSMLISEALVQVAFERERCVQDVLEPHKRLARDLMRLRGLRERMETSHGELEGFAKPDRDEAESRRPFELDAAHVTDDLVRRRRQGEHRAQRDRLHREYERERVQYEAARSDAEGHRLDILARCELAAYRARALWHHYQCRRAVYNQQLARSHRDGARLNQILERAEPRLPDWVEEPHRLAAELNDTSGDLLDTDPMES